MLISICMVAYNEEKCISSILNDILGQTYSHSDTEIVIVDNNSTDQTYNILLKFRDEHIREYRDIKILKNNDRMQSSGLNMAIDAFSGDVFVRVDAHATIDSRFIEETVACLEGTHTGIKEYVCGGVRPTYTDREGGAAALLLTAEQSRFGASAANYRGEPERCYVDSIFHAAYRREVIEKVGKFDPRLWRTEDNNYNYRVREAGYRICFEPRIRSGQQIRSSLSKMLRQKYQNGYWIGYTLGICPKCLSLFHFVPFALVGAVAVTSILSVFGYPLLGALMWGAYAAASIAASVMAAAGQKKLYAHYLLLPFVFLLMHICYGAGTFVGIAKMLFSKKTLE